MQRRSFLALTAGGIAGTVPGCLGSDGDSAAIESETLTLATATTAHDTGLLGVVNGPFENRYGVEVQALSQGTGRALETARNGDADVVLVHAPPLEDEFLRQGYGINRRDLMYNDFVVVGPDADPAGIDGMDDVTAAFAAIATAEAVFISRGDNSGTHVKELAIWEESGVDPGGEWYREAGTGMGNVLNQADLTGAYTLSDRGTFLSRRTELDIGIRVEGTMPGDPDLLSNPYGVIAVDPAIHEGVSYDLAISYLGFLTSQQGQSLVADHTVGGQQLFVPNALSEEPTFDQYVPENWTPSDD